MLNQIHSTQHLLTYLLRSYQCWRQESQLSGCKHDIQCAIWHNVTALSTICCDIYILLLYCQLYLCLTPCTVLTTCTVHVFMLLLLVFEFLQLYYILFVFFVLMYELYNNNNMRGCSKSNHLKLSVPHDESRNAIPNHPKQLVKLLP